MAIDAAALAEALAAARISGSSCQDAADLARQMEEFSQVVENTFQTFYNEIINIINNGGGGATAPVYIIRALVNQLGGVPASQQDFAFDGETLIFSATGNAPIFDGDHPRVARNPGRYLQDNEVVELTSFNGQMWLADKISENTIKAKVDVQAGVAIGDKTFTFRDAVPLGTGPVFPTGGFGTAVNITGNAYSYNEVLVLKLVENPEVLVAAELPPDAQAWAVVQDDDDDGGGGGGTSYTADFCMDAAKLADGKIALIDAGYLEQDYEFFGSDEGTPKWLSPTNYLASEIQVFGHLGTDAASLLKWFDTLICNPSP